MHQVEQLKSALQTLLWANAEVTASYGDRERRIIAIARQEQAELEAAKLLRNLEDK